MSAMMITVRECQLYMCESNTFIDTRQVGGRLLGWRRKTTTTTTTTTLGSVVRRDSAAANDGGVG